MAWTLRYSRKNGRIPTPAISADCQQSDPFGSQYMPEHVLLAYTADNMASLHSVWKRCYRRNPPFSKGNQIMRSSVCVLSKCDRTGNQRTCRGISVKGNPNRQNNYRYPMRVACDRFNRKPKQKRVRHRL